MKFKVIGECRKIGALGLFDKFSRNVEASSVEEAREAARELLKSEGYEHIHVFRVEMVS